MKFYVLNCGQMIAPEGNVLEALNTDFLRLVIPVPVYLIEHPEEGLILIDTGFDYAHLTDEMKENICQSPLQRIAKQIEALGYRKEDVRHVLLSHLHFDHAGQIDDFAHAVFHLRKAELDAALQNLSHEYLPADTRNLPSYNLHFLPEEETTDLFGDGTILCIDTKGHAPGNLSFLITLPHTGKILLAVDAAHLPQYFETDRFFEGSWDKALCVKAVETIRRYQKEADLTILGHDPAMWTRVKRAPAFYD